MSNGKEQLTKLQELDRKAPAQVKNLRAITAGWGPDDGRWDAVMAALDFACREHAHELAERIRQGCTCVPGGCSCDKAADLIDPEVST